MEKIPEKEKYEIIFQDEKKLKNRLEMLKMLTKNFVLPKFKKSDYDVSKPEDLVNNEKLFEIFQKINKENITIMAFYLNNINNQNNMFLHGMWPSKNTEKNTEVEFIHRKELIEYLEKNFGFPYQSDLSKSKVENIEENLKKIIQDFIYFVYYEKQGKQGNINHQKIQKVFPLEKLKEVASVYQNHQKNGDDKKMNLKTEKDPKKKIKFSSLTLGHETIKHFGNFKYIHKTCVKRIEELLENSLKEFFELNIEFPLGKFLYGKTMNYIDISNNERILKEVQTTIKNIIKKMCIGTFYYVEISLKIKNWIFNSNIEMILTKEKQKEKKKKAKNAKKLKKVKKEEKLEKVNFKEYFNNTENLKKMIEKNFTTEKQLMKLTKMNSENKKEPEDFDIYYHLCEKNIEIKDKNNKNFRYNLEIHFILENHHLEKIGKDLFIPIQDVKN